ncbi:MAG: Tar ligand binding domain-containing protein, partial [Nitrospirae bacterium]|nr:Tar ligand binding domain-containing protein [Nitrospirota bacterium]
MLRNVTVLARMLLLLAITVVLTTVIIVLGYVIVSNLSSTINEVNTDGVLATRYLASAQDAMWQLRYGISQYIAVQEPASRKKIIDESPKWFGVMDENLRLYSNTKLNEEAISALKEMTDIFTQYKEARP